MITIFTRDESFVYKLATGYRITGDKRKALEVSSLAFVYDPLDKTYECVKNKFNDSLEYINQDELNSILQKASNYGKLGGNE